MNVRKPKEFLLDARGWSRPWCVLQARHALFRMAPGQILELLVNDPLVPDALQELLGGTGKLIGRSAAGTGDLKVRFEKTK